MPMPLTLSLEKNGRRYELRLESVSAAEDAAGMNTSWIHARDETTVPKLTQSDGPDGDRPNDFVYLKDQRTVYAVYNCVCDSKTETVELFAKRLFDLVEKNAPDKLIIDVRGNGGGDNYLNQPLLLGMIRAQSLDRPGHLFVLTGPHTFSAAQNFANQSERWTQALFVGEPTGSAPNIWGDAKQIELPQTKLHPMIATLYWQDSDPRDHRVWILPDVAASDTFADWVAGRDRALEAALAYKAGDAPPAEAPDGHWRRPSQRGDWQFHF